MPWDMSSFNISGTLNIFRLIAKPSLCLPHATVSTFNDLPIPLSKAFDAKYGKGKVNIRAVVLDKDDCFAIPKENEVFKDYKAHFAALRTAYPAPALLIVSNTAGSSSDPTLSLSHSLSANTSVPVLSHRSKKPGCGAEIMSHFRAQHGLENLRECEVAIVGDRLATDMMLANLMGGYGVWVKAGVVGWEEKSFLAKMEQKLAALLMRRGYEAPVPKSQFEGDTTSMDGK